MNKDTDCQNWNAGPDKIKRMCRPNTLTTNMQAYSLSQDSGRCLSTALMWGQRKADFHGHFLGQFCPGWQWCQHCRNLQRWDYSSKQWDYSSKRWDYSSKAARCNTEKAGHRNDWHIIAFFCFFSYTTVGWKVYRKEKIFCHCCKCSILHLLKKYLD